MRKVMHVILIALLVGGLTFSAMQTSAAFLINKDVKQTFVDPQDNFEIELQGDWRDVMTDSAHTINPFGNGQVQISYNPGPPPTTTISFSGDPISMSNDWHHFGFGYGHFENHGLINREYWTRGTIESNVSGGSSSYEYDPESRTMAVTVSNDMVDPTIIADVGYLVFPTEQPLSTMDRNTMPPGSFTPSGIPDGTVLYPGQSISYGITDVQSTDWVVTFQSVRLETPPPGGYEEEVGEWVQIPASRPAGFPALTPPGFLLALVALLGLAAIVTRKMHKK